TLLSEDAEPEVLDAGIIAGAQKIEHYEIAAYGTVRNYANLLGRNDWMQILEVTLEEEKQADKKLTQLAEHINVPGQSSLINRTGISSFRRCSAPPPYLCVSAVISWFVDPCSSLTLQ